MAADLIGEPTPSTDSYSSYVLTPFEKQRLRREKLWNDSEISEKVALDPYLLLYNLSSEESLERARKQAETIQTTNVVLQQRLKEYAVTISALKEQLEARQLEYDELIRASETAVQGTGTLSTQLHALREQRISEECRLRAHSLELHERLMLLTQENARLETARHEEEKQLKQGRASLDELTVLQLKFEHRKADLQNAFDDFQDEPDTPRMRSSVHSDAAFVDDAGVEARDSTTSFGHQSKTAESDWLKSSKLPKLPAIAPLSARRS